MAGSHMPGFRTVDHQWALVPFAQPVAAAVVVVVPLPLFRNLVERLAHPFAPFRSKYQEHDVVAHNPRELGAAYRSRHIQDKTHVYGPASIRESSGIC